MLKIVIIDDSKEDRVKIKKIVDSVFTDCEVAMFSQLSEDLENEIKDSDNHKIYIIDIELGGKESGIKIAKMIREVSYNNEIIFISNHDKMFELVHRSVFEVFDFIEKFHDFEKRLKKDLKIILNRNFDNKMFIYNSCNASLSIFYRNILYIYRETEERKLVIVTDNNKYKVALNVNEIMPYLDQRFKQVHRSCIVNLDRVQERNYKEGNFKLDTGEVVYMLSKKFKG